jgi:hypothetical protein
VTLKGTFHGVMTWDDGIDPPDPTPPPNGTKAVLTAADLEYIGAIRMPDSGWDPSPFNFSVGAMTSRTDPLSGNFTLLLSGPKQGANVPGPQLGELALPEPAFGEYATLPRATLLRTWPNILARAVVRDAPPTREELARRLAALDGDIQASPPYRRQIEAQRRVLLNQLRDVGLAAPRDPHEKATGEYPVLYGLQIDPATGLLWYAYSTCYEGNSWNPSLGCNRLHDDGSCEYFGPWRTSLHSGRTNGFMGEIPEAVRALVGGRSLFIGNPPHAGNASAPFGGNLNAWQPLDPATPPDGTDDEHWSIDCVPLLFQGIDTPLGKTANYRACGWNVPYDPAQGGWSTPGVPFFGGPDKGALLDWLDVAAWIDLPTKHGVLAFGQIVDTLLGKTYDDGGSVTDLWYGPDVCIDGQRAKNIGTTGPHAGSLALQAWIFSPDDLIAVAKGELAAHAVEPRSTFRAHDLGAFIHEECLDLYTFGGIVFDSATRRIYVSQARAVNDNYNYLPFLHVFQVHALLQGESTMSRIGSTTGVLPVSYRCGGNVRETCL